MPDKEFLPDKKQKSQDHTIKSRSMGKSALHLTIAKVITTLIALVSSMLLSRFRTLSEYGTYSQILIVISLATALFLLGLPSSTNYFLALAETHEERQHFLSVYFSLNTTLCFLMGGVLAACVPLIAAYFGNELIRNFTYILVLLPWTKVIIGSISNILVVYGKTEKLTIFNIANTAVALAAVLLTKLLNWSFREYMLLFLLGEGVMMLWVYVMVWNLEKPLRISFDKRLISKIFKYSIPIGLAGLVGTLSVEIDKLMIGRFFDTEQLAIYTNAAKELPLTIVATSLTAVLLPQMARMLKAEDIDGAVSLWGDTIELSYIIICFCSTALVVFAPQIMTILYSEKYLPGVSVFRVYSLVLLLRCTYFGLVLNSIGKTKFILYSSIVSLALNIVLNYVFYLLFGMVGPAIATFLSIAVVNFAQLYATSKVIEVSLRNLFPWRRLIKITAINILIGAAAYIVSVVLSIKTSTVDIVKAVLIGIVMAGVYYFAFQKTLKRLWRRINRA